MFLQAGASVSLARGLVLVAIHRERASLVHRALRYQFAVYHDAPVLCRQNGLQPEERRESRRNERMAARGMDAGVSSHHVGALTLASQVERCSRSIPSLPPLILPQKSNSFYQREDKTAFASVFTGR